MKTLLALGASRLNFPALQEMRSVARVVAVDQSPYEIIEEPGFKSIQFDFADQDGLLDLARRESVNGVYPFSDHSIRPSAFLCAALGFVGLTGDSAENFLDKARMRQKWDMAGLSQPRFAIIKNLNCCLNAAKNIGYPVIIKPASSGGGGRGVFRVDSDAELIEYFPLALIEARYSDLIIVEEYILGVESSLELIFLDGKANLIAISSKIKAESKSQVATEISYPADLSSYTVRRICDLCISACNVLGMISGVVHCEVITKPNGFPYLVEVGGRVGGGHTFHPIASHVSGINYPQLVACLYLADFNEVRVRLSRGVRSRGAVYSFPVTSLSGNILEIGFSAKQSGAFAELWKNPGDTVQGMSSSLDRLGCVVSLAEGRKEAIEDSRLMIKSFSISISH